MRRRWWWKWRDRRWRHAWHVLFATSYWKMPPPYLSAFTRVRLSICLSSSHAFAYAYHTSQSLIVLSRVRFGSIRFDLVSPLILVFLFYYTMPLLFRILHVAPTLHSFLIILNPPRVAFRNYYPIARVFVISFPLFFHDPVLSIIYYYCIIYSLLLSTYIYSMATTLNIGSLTVIAATSSSPNDNTSILFCFFCALLFVWNDFYNLIGPKWNRLNCVSSVLFQFLSEFHFLLLKSRHEA